MECLQRISVLKNNIEFKKCVRLLCHHIDQEIMDFKEDRREEKELCYPRTLTIFFLRRYHLLAPTLDEGDREC